MKIFLLLLTIMTSSCSKKIKEIPYVQAEFIKTYKVFGSFYKKRIILTHGVYGDDTQFDGGDLNYLRNELVNSGFQVITFSYPNTDSRIFLDLGKKYREQYLDFLYWLIIDTNEKLGTAEELDIGGFSFGGLHAIIGASVLPFDKYVAILPVTSPRSAYIFGNIQDNYFNAFYEVDKLKGKKGLITSSHDDSILGYVESKNLSYLVGSKFKDYFGVGGHNTNKKMIDDVLEFINE